MFWIPTIIWDILAHVINVQLGMDNIKILCYNNHPLKFVNYCKYYDIHLVGYDIAVKLKSQANGKIYTTCHKVLMF